MRDVWPALREAQHSGQGAALVTVVSTRGSTYRKAGAHMLVRADGSTLGAVSGGCLEDDVAEVATGVIVSGEPVVRLYDTSLDDDLIWGMGLGCAGAIEVLVEPAAGQLGALAAAVDACMAPGGRPAVLGAVIDPAGAAGLAPGDRTLLTGEQAQGSAALAALLHRAGVRPDRVQPGMVELAGGVRAYLEPVLPAPHLVVFGAGYDAVPMARQARAAGFRVTVWDKRPGHLVAGRFPGAELVNSEAEAAPEACGVRPGDCCVVMTHNYLNDRAMLPALVAAQPVYLGVLGPRARTQKLLDETGLAWPPFLYGPAGLDLGAEGPEEVALALVAEMLAVRRGRDGGFLRQRKAPIHAPGQ